MICPDCSTTLTKLPENDLSFCATCNVFELTPETDSHLEQITAAGQETGFLCPTCPDQNLQVGNLFGTQVCYCDQCSGFVIDRMTLGELIDELRASYDGPDDEPIQIKPTELHQISQCPACLEKMETFNYYGPGNVILDTCVPCKLTWFNHGELGKIIRAPGRRTPPPSYNQESSMLRQKLYDQATQDGAVGMWLLIR
jgi:Zn-finger nucleic acid-binding protein